MRASSRRSPPPPGWCSWSAFPRYSPTASSTAPERSSTPPPWACWVFSSSSRPRSACSSRPASCFSSPHDGRARRSSSAWGSRWAPWCSASASSAPSGSRIRPLPRVPGSLLAKDATVFLRDASQWSQLLLVFALVGIYLYNFSALPLDDGTPLADAMRDLATILNLGLGAFVTTAVAVRFV